MSAMNHSKSRITVVRCRRIEGRVVGVDADVNRSGPAADTKDVPDFAGVGRVDADRVVRGRRAIIGASLVEVVRMRSRIDKQPLSLVGAFEGEIVGVAVSGLIIRTDRPN